MSTDFPRYKIDSLDDPRIERYQNLRDRTLRGESLFIAEGQLLTERLLASRFPVESLLVIERQLHRIKSLVPPDVPVYLAEESLVSQIIGYPFHLGMLAAGCRLEAPPLEELLEKTATPSNDRPRGWIVLPEVTKPDNLGLIFRSAAALGIEGILLGRPCCDPFSRRAMRLSMGAVLQLPYAWSDDLNANLAMMEDRFGFETLATVLDENATTLENVTWPNRTAILFGNEYDGLHGSLLREKVHRITIPMSAGVDSLNLSVSVGIFLYAWRRAAME
ncbi:MAG: RNA methyltransferase [Planctomycetia bacterium]|jgi:tRNA G18 (ribose-2'-O)-methylase SpoU